MTQRRHGVGLTHQAADTALCGTACVRPSFVIKLTTQIGLHSRTYVKTFALSLLGSLYYYVRLLCSLFFVGARLLCVATQAL